MATRSEIKKCNDVELLQALAINQQIQLTVISEILVSESKMHASSRDAINNMRDYLRKNYREIDLNWLKMQLDGKKKIDEKEETVTISKKEYELLKKHQKEYGTLLDTLSDNEEICEFIRTQNIIQDNYCHVFSFEQTIKSIGEEFKERIKRK